MIGHLILAEQLVAVGLVVAAVMRLVALAKLSVRRLPPVMGLERPAVGLFALRPMAVVERLIVSAVALRPTL